MKINLLNALFTIATLFLTQVLLAQKPDLGTSANFAVFTSVGAFDNLGATNITGNIGTNSGAMTGFPPGVVIGQAHVASPIAQQAAIDLDIAYNAMSALTCGATIGTNLGNGQTLTPNIYCLGAASTLTDFLTLDAQNNPNAVFVFIIDGALTTSISSNITLINGASVDNVFWQIKGAFTEGESTVFKGTVLANGAVSLLSGASFSGRILTRQGAVSLHNVNGAVVLPIDLVYFTAQKEEDTVELNWATVTERNIVRYELQRSYNARDFETLVSFAGSGQTDSKKTYTYSDKSPFINADNASFNIVYYRVKQVDTRNVFNFSKVIAVAKETMGKVSLYPNPTSYQITVKNGATGIQPFTIKNLSGVTVGSGEYTATNALDISHLPAGYYTLYIQSMNIRFLKN